MSDPGDGKRFTFGGSAVYRIVVQGCLDEEMSDRLGGMRIETTGDDDATPVTRLLGRLRDQAELSGVLNTLYEMHLPVLEVQVQGDE
jgi:hypothetical protein